MADERLRTKGELKKLVAQNLKLKGWTDDMASILIDVLWRDKYTMRTSGFYYPGGTDAIIAFDNATRIFSIEPLDPLVEDFIPRFGFYSWSQRAVYHRRYENEEIELPNEEGLFAIYFAADEISRTQQLHFIKNPTEKEKKDLYIKQVLVSFIYWDFDMQTALHFGNDRHGSEWNPQMHWMMHKTLKGQINDGLTVSGMLINQDGSLDSHARFTVDQGSMWHDDMILDIPTAGGTNTIQVLYFSGASVPRFIQTNGFGVYKGSNRITYNANSTSLIEADSGKFCMYHIFAVNEHIDSTKKVISVMGTNQYDTIAEAHKSVNTELDSIYANMPQQGSCYLGSAIFEVNDSYTNAIKARIVFFIGESHLPVTIHPDSTDYFEIDEYQVLKHIPQEETIVVVNQIAHGFVVGQPIRHNETSFVGAIANNKENAQTAGIVTAVIDVDTFQYQSEGFLLDASFEQGKEYFLSPLASTIITLADPEVWSIGEVRQSLGWGTPQGLKIEIDVGDEIISDFGIGIPGETGAQGPQGIPGEAAEIGYQGPQGFQGDIGAQGYQGFQGNIGITGAIGSQGADGAQGATGSQGDDGAQGSDGTQGLRGFQGYTGNTGAQGADGNQGVQGAIGNQGFQGFQGDIGSQGDDGADSTVQGPQGFQGETGSQGNQGFQGLKGNTGSTGPQGYQGLKGNTGSTGPQGYQGLKGNTGSTGPQGYQGVSGSDGSQGYQGYQGVAGSDASCLWEDAGAHTYLKATGDNVSIGTNSNAGFRLQVTGSLYASTAGIGTTNITNKFNTSDIGITDFVGLNSYYSSGWKSINTGYASIIKQNTGGYFNLSVMGTASAGSTHSETGYFRMYNSDGRIVSNRTMTASNFILDSERKLKRNIKPLLENEKIDLIELKSFIFKADKTNRKRYGAIVDEVEPIAPEFIYTDQDGVKTIAYIDLLLAKVARLENKVSTLINEM